MKNLAEQFTEKSRTLLIYIAVAAMLLLSAQMLVLPGKVSAAQLTDRTLTLGSSAPEASTTHTFDFNMITDDDVGSIIFEYCDSASGACTPPTDINVDGVTLSNQSGETGFAIDATLTTADTIVIERTPEAVDGPVAVSYTFSSAVNPSDTNTTFFVRISTTDAVDGGGSTVDTGVVAASTATQITITGTMDESLVFCSGTSITGANCGTISGSAVTLDSSTLSSTAARYGTSVFAASTNGVSGYSVTVNGSTLTCSSCAGSPTIAAMGTQSANGSPAASSPGTAQFGMNLRANDGTPTVGAAIAGTGSGTQGANYNTNNQYRFFTGDEVALASAATDANAFTVSYIINVPGSQAAGTYTSTMTYIATATF